MSRELEERLASVPERWRDATRTRAYAVIDYIAAGEDGALLVDVLCRRTGLTTSAFYALVRRYKASKGDAASLAPWARRPESKPRIPQDVTAHIDSLVTPLIAENPARPTEPIAQTVLASWPDHLTRPGISYVRRRVNHVRSEHQKKTRRTRRNDGDEDGHAARPRTRWPLDVIIIDHIAIETVVWDGDEPELPIATLAIDVATHRPVGLFIGLDGPGPAAVACALGDLARLVSGRRAPGPPTIIMSTAYAHGWPELVQALASTGATVLARRSRKLTFGDDANRLLDGKLGGYRLAPRLGHRPRGERATPRAVSSMPNREMGVLQMQLQSLVSESRDAVAVEQNWPPAAIADPRTWEGLAVVATYYAES